MPSATIQVGNGLCRQGAIVGKKDESLVVLGVVVSDSPEL
jgi:hypothetical protein